MLDARDDRPQPKPLLPRPPSSSSSSSSSSIGNLLPGGFGNVGDCIGDRPAGGGGLKSGGGLKARSLIRGPHVLMGRPRMGRCTPPMGAGAGGCVLLESGAVKEVHVGLLIGPLLLVVR